MSNAPLNAPFQRKQAEFAAYIRDPSNQPAPGDVPKQRMDTYRELFFNNVDSFLATNFPVIKTILDETQWCELSQDFFSRHHCQTPYFSEIPEEFIDFLQHERRSDRDYPFLVELAHYEWVEMALAIAQEQTDAIAPDQLERLAEQPIALSPLAWPLAYQYPVQRISPNFLPEAPPEQPTYLVVYRDAQDDVHFLEINALTYALLQNIQTAPGQTAGDYFEQLAKDIGHPEPTALLDSGLQILRNMADKSVIRIAGA